MQSGNANVLLLLNAQQTYLQAIIQVVQARAAGSPIPRHCFRRLAEVGGTESIR